MSNRRILGCLAALMLVTGCAGGSGGGFGMAGQSYFRLVRPQPVRVARATMVVTPTVEWNRLPRGPYDISREENWTLNGPILDGLTFIGGIDDNSRLVVQRRKDDRQVPNFRANMTPPEIASIIESFYRIRGGSTTFTMTRMEPRTFLGHPGFQFDFEHLGGNEVERQGRAVGAIINGRFYMALFDAAKMHYFPAGLPEFERIVTSARLRT